MDKSYRKEGRQHKIIILEDHRTFSCRTLLKNVCLYEIGHTMEYIRVLSFATLVIALKKKNDHVTPILKRLHWLHVNEKIKLKILCTTYQCMNG